MGCEVFEGLEVPTRGFFKSSDHALRNTRSDCAVQDTNMESSDVLSLVEDMGSNIDDLEEALAPLLETALSASTSKLPLLDKAKLYVLVTYAIESILFSALRLNGVDAKEHPVFQELNRVKEYFAKIKTAEAAGAKRSTVVNREAAGRIIKHGLAGNERYDRERAERGARERAGAKRKLEDISTGTHTRFDGAAKRIQAQEEGVTVVSAADVDEEEDAEPVEGAGAALISRPIQSQTDAFEARQIGSASQGEGRRGKKKKRKGRAEIQQDLEDTRAAEMK
ncbi:hypothetical protein LTR29_007543 [Friedmanniomyces endolithicus]|nr:hypothetical protein LTS09_013734 [Friedmanniomyces endolithicus]KAK0940825.1 hypothetical protein LTR29_007543 [Friedmanniomyces endolithicus]